MGMLRAHILETNKSKVIDIYLLCGADGVGKSYLSSEIIRALNVYWGDTVTLSGKLRNIVDLTFPEYRDLEKDDTIDFKNQKGRYNTTDNILTVRDLYKSIANKTIEIFGESYFIMPVINLVNNFLKSDLKKHTKYTLFVDGIRYSHQVNAIYEELSKLDITKFDESVMINIYNVLLHKVDSVHVNNLPMLNNVDNASIRKLFDSLNYSIQSNDDFTKFYYDYVLFRNNSKSSHSIEEFKAIVKAKANFNYNE